MWYNHLNKYLLRKGYVNNDIFPCMFIMKTSFRFSIVLVFVDDMNLIGTPKGGDRNYYEV